MLIPIRNKVVGFFGSNAYANSMLRVVTQYQVNRRDLSAQQHSITKTVCHGDFSVTVLPAMSDNFMYLVKPYDSPVAILVDPVDHRTAAHELTKQQSRLDTILCTHHHADHDSGNEPLKRLYPQDSRVSGATKIIEHNYQTEICGLNVLTLHTPVHTIGHGCFIVKSSTGPNAVFVGDTLFHGGCGRFFEGTASDMIATVDVITNNVDKEDLMYFGHEYSITNLSFAKEMEPSNSVISDRLDQVEQLRCANVSTTPTPFDLEYKTNPFLRLSEKALQEKVKATSREDVCRILRELKDNY